VTDTEVRLAAFEWLDAQVSLDGDVLPRLRNTLVVEDARTFAMQYRDTGLAGVDDEDSVDRRRYVTAQVRVRLHQSAFRERVLYHHACNSPKNALGDQSSRQAPRST